MAAPHPTLLFSPGFQQLLDNLLDHEIRRVDRILGEARGLSLRGHCQQELARPGEPGYADECYAPASISDRETSLAYCVDCWKETL